METKILFANLLGLKLKDMQHSAALVQVFFEIQANDINAFYGFCKKNKHRYERELRGTMLISLYHDFLKSKEEMLLPHKKAEGFSDTLIEKLSQVVHDVDFILNNGFLVKDMRIVFKGVFTWGVYQDNKPFTKSEKNALYGLGKAQYVISAYKDNTLRQELLDLYLKKYLQNIKKKNDIKTLS